MWNHFPKKDTEQSDSSSVFMSYNGQILPDNTSIISVYDRGLSLGDGFFTTTRYKDGHILFFDDHWDRLIKSAEIFKIYTLPFKGEIEAWIHALMAKNPIDHAIIRITITRGVQKKRGITPDLCLSPTIVIQSASNSTSRHPISVYSSAYIRFSNSPLSHIKHLGYQLHILAQIEATEKGCDSAMLWNERGHSVCTSTGNVFFKTQTGDWITPPLEDGCIDGIVRRHLIDYLGAVQKSISCDDMGGMQAGFSCNCGIGILPIQTCIVKENVYSWNTTSVTMLTINDQFV